MRKRLIWFWWLCVITCASLAAIMVGLYQQTSDVQIEQGHARVEAAGAAIAQAWVSPRRVQARRLEKVLSDILKGYGGVEGGIWQPAGGFVAYAFPSYVGTGIKQDIPVTEANRIARLAARSLRAGRAQSETQEGGRETLVLYARPREDPASTVAWTMRRVQTASANIYMGLFLGLAILLAFVTVTSAWLGRLLHVWSRHLAELERSLTTFPIEPFPELERTGEQELDRIVGAVNAFNERLRAARDKSEHLVRKLAPADRLATVGRMAAGLAHEIRNPIGTMRLKAENAVAAPKRRALPALKAILDQVGRLDHLMSNLLNMTQPVALELAEHDLRAWLQEQVGGLSERAHICGVELRWQSPQLKWQFDRRQLGRAMDNLVLNAIQHTPAGGRVQIDADQAHGQLVLRVNDTGSGVEEAPREEIFEPFVTGRHDGTELGLALAREIIEAHDGGVHCVPQMQGSCFEVRIPWALS